MSYAPEDTIVDRAVEIRRDLHMHPELGYEEHRTHDLIVAELRRLGIEHRSGLAGGTGVLAWLPGRDTESAIALRADIDALPIEEETDVAWRSTHPGRMHACGHDGHTAILLGTAANLAARADTLERSVLLVFQPAEEGLAGGKRMVEDGVLDGSVAPMPAARIYGLHGWPGVPEHVVGSRIGPLLAASDRFEIDVVGTGCHAAFPHHGADPVAAAAAITTALSTIVARNCDPLDAAVVSTTIIQAGTGYNVIPNTARIGGTARSLVPEVRDLLERRIEEVAAGVATAHGCRATTRYERGYPVTVNHEEPTSRFREIAIETLGESLVQDVERPFMGGEDFAYYGQRIPACFYILGQQSPDGPEMPPLHAATYDFNDRTIPTGITLMSRLSQEG